MDAYKAGEATLKVSTVLVVELKRNSKYVIDQQETEH